MSAEKPTHRWRENVEALTMAIVVALLFKYFVLEISKIPSGSMQPTLMGNPETGIFDRTLVDKLSYHFRDPERFEIVVFKHPLERSRVMVKRLVGMPGEELKIENGDLWTRVGSEPWRILRRPPRVQAASWRELVRPARDADWSVVRGGKEWFVSGAAIRARGDGAARFRVEDGPITDHYLDGYPDALLGRFPQRESFGRNHVADVRLTGDVRALPGTTAVAFELTEGRRTYEFRVPGPAAPEDAQVSVSIRDSSSSSERVEQGERFRLAAGERVAFAAENLDDRLVLELDGRTRLAAEIEPSAQQQAQLTLSVAGEGADLDDLCVARDVYYRIPETSEKRGEWSAVIPPGHYVMLGDNAQDSADSRLWEAGTFVFPGPDGATLEERGNIRSGENPAEGRMPDGSPAVRFRDRWGEIHWFAKRDILSPTEPADDVLPADHANAPLVPRELILGRALAVFWPIRPFQGLWRVGWLH